MYLNFSNFRGRTSAGGGQALVQKRGQVSDGGGGDWQNFRRMGGPPSSPRKKNPAHANFKLGVQYPLSYISMLKSYHFNFKKVKT